MKIVILEDEALAAERLEKLIKGYNPTFEILKILDTVEEAIEWFDHHESPDLAFFDIQLADGNSFQIFEQTQVTCPLIFTTAYDQYALKAFKVNSIDYLLKPIDETELAKAFNQYEQLQASLGNRELQAVQQALRQIKRNYKSRFIIRSGHQFLSLKTDDILYFYSEHKTVWAKHANLKKHAIDMTLEQLEEALDPSLFFRINRQYIISFIAIEQTTIYSNSRLRVNLLGMEKNELILVSRDRVGGFKAWLDQ